MRPEALCLRARHGLCRAGIACRLLASDYLPSDCYICAELDYHDLELDVYNELIKY